MIKRLYSLAFMLCLFASYSAFANNISVINFSLTGQNTQSHYAMIKFDISWENSWRTSSAPNNWDAAWVFVKYRVNGTGEWQHAWLNNTGHVNPAGSSISTGLLKNDSAFHQTTNPGIGVFIYRDANGTGTFSKTGVQLRWNYGANGVTDAANIDIRVFAIEQVYVPQGSFYIGSGGTEPGGFYKYPATTNPYQITNEGAINVSTTANNLYYFNPSSYSGDQQGPIPATFPKGYNAFYCMKYEISQQGYVDFLNSLTQTQSANRFPDNNGFWRHAISGSGGVYYTTNPFVACNNLGWADLAAYLDWSGLRPMTELEFEKSCRGTQEAVPNEYAWGNTSISDSLYTTVNNGASIENISINYSTVSGNSAVYNTIPRGLSFGPLRVGIFAGNGLNTGRVSSGAAFYGIMEMTGNLIERIVTIGNATGRAFTGTNGNGSLNASGNADEMLWPPLNSTGSGFRGGDWFLLITTLRVSDRDNAARGSDGRYGEYGGRGVRKAPIQ